MLDCLEDAGAAALPLHAATPAALPALLGALPPAAAAYLRAAGFAARPGQLILLPGDAASGLAGAVLGLDPAGTTCPWSYGALPWALPEGTAWRAAPGPAAEGEGAAALVLGWCLGAYRYRRFKPSPRAAARLAPPAGTGDAARLAAATWMARDLVNTPASHLGPAELAAAAAALAARHGADCQVVEGEALERGFPALAAVGGGSPRAPRVAVLRWAAPGAPADAPLVALCGKGVCFDTGGLDLKPSAAMLRMKKDMGGAAVVLGVARLVMEAALPVRLLVLVGAVENAVSGTAMRPLDVLSTRLGLSVEVGNTDAEGRLVLADLLASAAEEEPALIVDCATLTGAARAALGPDLPALFASHDALADQLLAAGRAAHDPLWRLPLHDGYAPWLDSRVADLNTVSSKPMAGAVVAALFLRRFVPEAVPWAHLDLYAWNDAARPGRPEGGEAQGLRALFGLLRARFGAPRRDT